MKYLLITILLVFSSVPALAQQAEAKSKSAERPITIKLWTGEELRGVLVKVDNETVDFKVKNTPQSLDLDKVERITFDSLLVATPNSPQKEDISPMSSSLRPVILYKERARYTKEAREHKVEGTVLLSLVYTSDGNITSIKVLRGLPDGLTESAIEAAKKIRFTPAMKNGKPVSVRGIIEFNFTL